MRFLLQKDYERIITVDDLNQVFDNGSDATYTVQQRILDSEPAAQEEISGYLKQRYDVSAIFTDTSVFNIASTYYGNDRVQYTEGAFSASVVYTTGERVSYGGSIYASTAGSAAHAFVGSEWTFVCLDGQLFYALLPQPAFDFGALYNLGDQVFWKNNIYASRVGNNNALPSNAQAWILVSAYSFTGALPTDTSKWIMGDNRNGLLVQKMVDIVLYHAHATINKRNIPELRITRYMGDKENSAIAWLNKLASGAVSANLPELPPDSSELALRWGNRLGDNETNNTQTPKMSY